jgi:hypothetical protein
MKKVNPLIFLALLLPLYAYAAQIYGSLKEDGRAVPEKTRIEVICNGKAFAGVTDGYGAYNVYASEKGKCVFKVYHKGQAPTFALSSYENPVRYDFDLVLVNGQYTLRRK